MISFIATIISFFITAWLCFALFVIAGSVLVSIQEGLQNLFKKEDKNV